MDSKSFQIAGKELIDYMVNFMETIRERHVAAPVDLGFLTKLVPERAPEKPEQWSIVFKDIEDVLMKGMTHWQHPHFFAYFPAGNGYPSILGDMLSAVLGCVGFSWNSSPAITELEGAMLDWYGRAIGLPDCFIQRETSVCGGCVLSSASDCIYACILAARHHAIQHLKLVANVADDILDSQFLPLLVLYTSNQAHSCVEKGAKLALVQIRVLNTDENESLIGDILQKAIDKDVQAGLLPFFVSATIGTTSCCSFDNLVELGNVVKGLQCCWFHIDAAYAGSGFICPELRDKIWTGLEVADSINVNPNKWLTVASDCSCLWVKEKKAFIESMIVNPVYLRDEYSMSDLRHWGIPLSRRNRAIKLWFTFRLYGITGLQEYIRNHVKLAKSFERKLSQDDRFEIVQKVVMGLVCFRAKGSDSMNCNLICKINDANEIMLTPSKIKDKYILRFAVNSEFATEADIDFAVEVIKRHRTELEIEVKKIKKPDFYAFPIELIRRYSNTHRLSKEDTEKLLITSLYDGGATPMLMSLNNLTLEDFHVLENTEKQKTKKSKKQEK